MADKEATIYVVDVGKSMGLKRNGRDETDFDFAMQYVWDKIATTVRQSKRAALRIQMPGLREVKEHLIPSSTNKGDAISALVVAIQMIHSFCKKLKYTRKIILVTNGDGSVDDDGLGDIVAKIKEDGIELVILGVDFDDAEFGFKEEDKDSQEHANERVFNSLTEECDGVFGTVAQAVSELGIPRLKTVRPMPSYKGTLTLGNSEEYDTAMSIDVERFPRTMIARAPSASSFVVRKPGETDEVEKQPDGDIEMQDAAGDGMAPVRNERMYTVKDDNTAGGKREVKREDLAKGYEYGRTLVHLSASDESVTKFEGAAGLDVVGFIPRENYDHYMNLSRTNVIIAQRTNDLAAMALASFTHTLYELSAFAVARLVPKEGKNPLLLLLAPSIEPDFECLIDVELPFAEDVRAYKFPPLDRIVTMSGKVLTEHRNLPSNDLQKAVGAYVDSMDLSGFDRDDDGNPAEYARMEETFSPVLHRINQAVRYRAVYPDKDVPPPSSVLTKYSQPPQELIDQSESALTRLKEVADVKKVPPKSQSRKQYRGKKQQEQPRSGLDVNAILSSTRKEKSNMTQDVNISPSNAIPEFKQLAVNAEGMDQFRRGVDQLSKIIENWISQSVGNSNYERAIEGIGVLREECIELEEPGAANRFIKGLKEKLLKEELGGDRLEFWWRFKQAKVGLIEKKDSSTSDVTEEDARKVS
ncbi:MAG: ATP-dependent DNA helicase II subunit 2 [Alyxoria varia]|nr:MAG: ATP-dependent DNA helicase II subunit 2 [Alyxoria varia]